MSLLSSDHDRSTADALDGLAGSIAAGHPVRAALSEWHRQVATDLHPALVRLRSSLSMGSSVRSAIELVCEEHRDFKEPGSFLASLLDLHERNGGDLSVAIRGLAVSYRTRAAQREEGRSFAAGARISGRVVSGLPLAFLPLGPLGRVPLFDVLGLVMLAIGVALAVIGMRWIERLIPEPPAMTEGLDTFVRSAALLVRAGLPIKASLDASARLTDLTELLNQVALGSSWSEALSRSEDPFLSRMGMIVARGESLGISVVESLDEVAEERHEESARVFQTSLRRAPVLMLVPLTLCVLPSFGLIALGPFLRGLAIT